MTFTRHALCAALALALVAARAQQSDQQQPPPRDPHRPVKIDPAYQKMADETGGTVYVFDREHPEQMGVVMAADLAAKRPLLATHGEISGERSFEAALEGTESKLVVTATGSLQSFRLRRRRRRADHLRQAGQRRHVRRLQSRARHLERGAQWRGQLLAEHEGRPE